MSAFQTEPVKERANFYSIKKGEDGRTAFRLKTSSQDPQAVARPYTNPKTKEEGVAYERQFNALIGVIENIEFVENSLADKTILRSINISLGKDEDGVAQVISLPQDSRFAADFLRKLPNIKLDEEVRFAPHDYEKDGRRKVGIYIDHRNPETGKFDVNVLDFFTKFEEKDGKWTVTNLNGIPEATEDDSQDWPFYFKKVEKFLINYAKTHIIPRFSQENAATGKIERSTPIESDPSKDIDDAFDAAFEARNATKDAINPEDVPF